MSRSTNLSTVPPVDRDDGRREGHRPYGNPSLRHVCALSAKHGAGNRRNRQFALVVTTDRTSNGPNVYYPNPLAPGGTGTSENWVLDSFGHDPCAKVAMVGTAENVARKWQISTEEQHDVVAQRYEQYCDATADNHAFQRRYMRLPFEVPDQVSKNCRDHDERRRCIRNHARRAEQVKTGIAKRYGNVRQSDASGRWQRVDDRHHPRKGICDFCRSEDRNPPRRVRRGAHRQGPHAARTCPRITTRSTMRAYRWTTSPP